MRLTPAIEPSSATEEVDLSRLGRALARRRWWVLGPTLLAFFAAFAFVNIVKPRYSADARLLLEHQDGFLTRVDKGERVDGGGPDAEAVQSQIQLLTSRDLARRAIKRLDLQGNPEFDPVARGVDAFTRLMVLLGFARDPTLLSPEDRILEKFGEKLSVLSPTKTRVLSVEFTSKNPDLAARGANTVAETYIDMQREAKREIARTAAASLATLVSDLHARVAEAEGKVEAYRAQTGLLIGSNNAIITTQQLGELNNQLSSARAAQADAEAKARLLRDMLRQKRVGEIPDVANNETIRRIFEQRVALRAQLALESRTLLPMHPRIKELNAQLADLDAQWRAAAERTARTLENDARIASARVENLTRLLDDQKRVAGAAGAEEVKLRDLERVARLLKEQLETETARYQEALARERVKATPADARIIQRALAPQLPSFPRKLPIIAFATLAGFVLSVGAVLATELLSGRARVEAIEEEATPAGDFLPAPIQPAFEASTPRTCVKVLVTPCDKEGKSADTAIALGRNLALQGRALLAVADRGRSTIDALARSAKGATKGLSDVVAGEADFGDAIYRDVGSRLHVMPGGVSDGEQVHELDLVLTALAHTYDFLVFAASREEAMRLAPHMDLAFVLGSDAEAETLRTEIAQSGADAHLLEGARASDDLVAA